MEYQSFFSGCKTAINFLQEFYDKGLTYSTIYTIRSALLSVKKPIDGCTSPNHPLIKYFLGVFAKRPALPWYKQMWDVSVVLKSLRFWVNLRPYAQKHVSLKTTMLLALVTSQRCQILHALNVRKMALTDHKCITDQTVKNISNRSA